MSHELPKHVEVYAKREYWEGRYGQKGGDFNHDDTTQYYDWCQSSYSEFVKLILDEGISPFDLILNVGCGDSRLSFDLLAKAMNICLFNVDYAESVISRMHREASNQDVQCWTPMDIRLLNIRSDSMDHVIDKGTMDALFSDGSSPWTPSLSVLNSVSEWTPDVLASKVELLLYCFCRDDDDSQVKGTKFMTVLIKGLSD